MARTRGGRTRPTASARRERVASRVDVEEGDLHGVDVQHEADPAVAVEQDHPIADVQEEVTVQQQVPTPADGPSEAFPGGPVDLSVLKSYEDHVATRIWSKQVII